MCLREIPRPADENAGLRDDAGKDRAARFFKTAATNNLACAVPEPTQLLPARAR